MISRIVLVVAFVLVFTGCELPPTPVPQSTEPATTNGGNYKVDLLFVHDGVRVYRFYDEWKWHYFVVPNTRVPAEATTSQFCGKNCEYDEVVHTLAATGLESKRK